MSDLCKDLRPRLQDQLDGRLNADDSGQVVDHLRTCRACATEHRELVALRDALRAFGASPAPKKLVANVMAAIAQEAPLAGQRPLEKGAEPAATPDEAPRLSFFSHVRNMGFLRAAALLLALVASGYMFVDSYRQRSSRPSTDPRPQRESAEVEAKFQRVETAPGDSKKVGSATGLDDGVRANPESKSLAMERAKNEPDFPDALAPGKELAEGAAPEPSSVELGRGKHAENGDPRSEARVMRVQGEQGTSLEDVRLHTRTLVSPRAGVVPVPLRPTLDGRALDADVLESRGLMSFAKLASVDVLGQGRQRGPTSVISKEIQILAGPTVTERLAPLMENAELSRMVLVAEGGEAGSRYRLFVYRCDDATKTRFVSGLEDLPDATLQVLNGETRGGAEDEILLLAVDS